MAKKSKSAFSFGGRVRKGINQEREKFASFGYLNLPNGIKALKIDQKNYTLDFLPYIVTDENHPERNDDEQLARGGDLWWRRPFRVHKSVGPDDETIVCPKSLGKPCPICEYVKKRREEEADQEEIYAIKSKGRYLYAVIPINMKGLDEEIMVWDYSYSLFEKQLDEELDNDPANDRFPGLEDGLTLEIRFREEKFGRGSYWETSRINFLERDAVYKESILEDVPSLDECLKVLSYEQLERMFFDLGDVDDTEESEEDDAEDNDPPAKATAHRKPKTVKRTKKDDEEDDDQEEKTTEEEEEEKTPPKKSSKPKRGSKPKTQEDECPSGYEFGADNNKYDECDDCDVWDTCNEAHKKLRRK